MLRKYELMIAPDIPLVFGTLADAASFIKDEETRWKALASLPTKHQSLRDRTIQHQTNKLREISTQVAQAARAENWAEQLGMMEWFAETHQPGGRILCSLIPADAAVLALADSDPEAAIIGMAARQRATETIQHIAGPERAEALLALYRYGIAAAGLPAQEQSFTAFAKSTGEALTRWRTEIEGAISKAAAAQLEAKVKATSLQTDAAAQATQHAEMLAGHQQTLKNLETRFLTEMTLRGPVQYWKDRAADGQSAAWWWLGGFVATALVIFGMVILAGPGLLSLLKDDKGQISLAGVPLLIAALIPLLWVLRHIARLFTDSIADARDAAQRSALTSTFLAMSAKEKVEFSKEERVIITQALFRPSPAQPVDEGVPVPLLELLKR